MPPKSATCHDEWEDDLAERLDALNDLAMDIRDTVEVGTSSRTDPAQKVAFEARLSRLDSTYDKFQKTFSEIRKLSRKLNKAVEPYETLKDEIRSSYYEAIAIGISTRTENVVPDPRASDSNRTICDTNVHPRLPTINIPSYSGNISNWASFKDTFSSLIHYNENLNDVQKFHYLKSALTGSAAQTVSGIAISQDGYTQAWDALTKRYDSKRIQATYHIMKILNFKPIQKFDLASLEQFSAIVMESAEAFFKLNLEKPEGFILSTIALKFLDTRSRDRFELKYGSNPDVFTWEQFSDFIQNQIVQLQSTALITNTVNSSSSAGSGPRFTQRPNNVMLASERSPISSKCPICQLGSHRIYDCVDFRKLNPDERMEKLRVTRRCINCFGTGHIGSSCPSSYTCRYCGKKHHSWLHKSNPLKLGPIKVNVPTANEKPGEIQCATNSNSQPSSSSAINRVTEPSTNNLHETINDSTVLSVTSTSMILLGTAIGRIQDNVGDFHPIRILVDSGSQRSFIISDRVRQLSLPISRTTQGLVGFGSQSIAGGKFKVSCTLVPQHSAKPELHTSAIVIDHICDDMPSSSVPERVVKYFESYKLADPLFHITGPIDFLLGADLFGNILKGDTIKSTNGIPSALDSVFGWIVLGPMNMNPPSHSNLALHTASKTQAKVDSLTEIMSKFWEIEEVANVAKINPLDAQCEQHFLDTHYRDESGRFVVKLPFKHSTIDLGSSKFMALNRFRKLEEKFHRDPSLKSEYSKVFQDYLEKNYIVKAPSHGRCFLPHHCVLKDSSSTKLRIVFDASAPISGGSLNDHLLTGPKLQRDIKDVMLNFRIPYYAMSADICQMYLQVWVAPEDRSYQHFLYRFEPTEALVEYEFNRLSFGMSCSPYLAIRVLHQLVLEDGKDYPLASFALMNHMYIDDLLTGANTISEALQLQSELIDLLGKGGFTLKKWSSNAKELLTNVPTDFVESTVSFSNMEDRVVKILGMQWEPKQDCLSYRVQTRERIDTKRGIMSAIARMYDPLGYLAPVVFKAKSILQELWGLQLDWDDPVPPTIAEQWKTFYQELPALGDITIPRCVLPLHTSKITLVGFADASSAGYAAVTYLHVESSHGHLSSRLLFSKTRLAPLKTLSIPRLELCAALLLVNCLKALRTVISQWNEISIYLVTDSTTVLSWLNLSPHLLKTFVANRVTKILELSPLETWHHARSQDNAADIASRGINPSRLPSLQSWWNGPEWLQRPRSEWPLTKFQGTDMTSELPEVKEVLTLLAIDDSDWNLEEVFKKFSSYTKLLRVFTYVLRFTFRAHGVSSRKHSGPLNLSELRHTGDCLIRMVQRSHQLSPLKESKSSLLNSLAPFVDSQGIVRVGGRLRNSPLSHDTKHPILLPHRSHLVNLLIDHYHKAYLHAGPQLLLSMLRQRFWIISGRKLIRTRVHRCLKCHRLRVNNITPFMGDLPLSRFEQGRPFLNIGVDFAGPFLMKESNRRKASISKAYMCLFICFSTKAVHVEVVSQLSTESFLSCLDRFIARRGCPSKIFSDNATNFVGASRYLKELNSWWYSNEVESTVKEHITNKGIEWHFIPPVSPHFGGLWEAGIKSLKFHLVRVVDSQALTFEELSTVVTRIEAVLNSRPLYPMSSSPEDFQVLTPGHFLIGAPLLAPPEPDLSDVPCNRLSRWQFLKRCINDFWKRWRHDYLTSLQQRGKWIKPIPSLTIGSLVLLREPHTPPLQWPVGRIVEVYPGRDGVIRVVKIKTLKGEYTRSVTRLSPLLPPNE